MAGVCGTLSLFGQSGALRFEPALLGTESPTGTGLLAVDLTAWKMKPRDLWIGWSDEQRQRHLPWVVNNGRFLILPWVHVKGLASKILAHAARQLPADWENHYGHPPLLLETLVDASRFRGTCYRAANWIYVGQSTGRGRMDREHKAHGQVIKDIYLYALVSDAKQRLCSGPTRKTNTVCRADFQRGFVVMPHGGDRDRVAAEGNLFPIPRRRSPL